MPLIDYCTTNCIPYTQAFYLVLGFTLAGWVAGILMYRTGQVWKARSE